MKARPGAFACQLFLSLCLLLAALGAHAAELRVYIDSDNNAATGCTVPFPGGSFAGAEEVLVTTVDTSTSPPTVGAVVQQACVAPPAGLSAPVPVAPGGWSVGVGVGVGGYDVIETYFPALVPAGTYRFGFVYIDPVTGTDGLVTVTGTPAGGPIVFAFGAVVPIPTLTDAGIFLLAFLLWIVAARALRRHKAPTALVSALFVAVMAGATIAAVTLDGQIADWAGVPQIASDPAGDAPGGSDIAAAFAKFEPSEGRIYLRVDVKTASLPAAVADAYSTAAGVPLAVAAPGVLANDALGMPAATVISFGGGSSGGTVTTNAAGATATFGAGGSLSVGTGGSVAFTPAAGFVGPFTFSYRAANIHGTSDGLVTIAVTQAPAITSPATATFTVGAAGSFTITTTGYPTPAITRSGTLPASLTLTDNGDGTATLSGTPAAGTQAASPYAQVLTATNLAGSATQNFTLNVCPVIAATPAAIAQPTRANPYSFALGASGGAGPYTFAVTAGALPAGLSMSAAGVIAGTPNASGAYGFTVTVTDNATGCTGTTAYSGTVNEPPVAGTDSYQAVGNTLLEVASPGTAPTPKILVTSSNVLSNDNDGNGGANGAGVTVTNVGTWATPSGGTITLAANGTFTYLPPVGFTGADSFTYTVSDGVGSSTGLINIDVVAHRVWYVNNQAAAGDGRSASPFNTLAAAAAAATGANDTIYVFAGDGSRSGQNDGVVLDNGQRLIGEAVALDAPLTVNGVATPTLRAAQPFRPQIGNTTGNGVTLGSGNTVRGLDIVGSSSGAAIFGANVGTLAISEVSVSSSGTGVDLTGVGLPPVNVALDGLTSLGGARNVNLAGLSGTVDLGSGTLSGAAGNAFDVSGGAASVTYAGTIANSSTGARVVSVANKTGGTVALSGAITSSGTNPAGVVLTSNAGATVNFSGVLNLSTGTNPAFTATGGGTVTATAATSTITTTSGTGLTITGTAIGAAGLRFQSISTNGAASGIVLNGTGSSGALTVTGTGSGGSGGTIQNTTGDGVSVTSGTFGFSWMTIRNTAGNGINVSNLVGASSLANSTVSGFDSGGANTENGLLIVNTGASTGSMTVTGSTFSNGASGNDAIFMESQGSGNMTLNVNFSTFTGLYGDAVQVNGITGATATVRVTIANSSFTNAVAGVGNGGISLNPFGDVNLLADINNNTFAGVMIPATTLGAIGITNGGTADADVTIRNNTIDNVAGGRGITITADGGTTDLLIDNNTVDNLGSTSKAAINVNFINNSTLNTVATGNVTVSNNGIGQSGATAGNLWTSGGGTANAILLQSLNGSTMTAAITGNVVDANTTSIIEVVRLRAASTTGFAGGTINATVVGNDLQDTEATTHVEFDATAGTSTLGGTVNLSITGNTVPGSGTGVIKLTENAAGTLNVTQASAAAVSSGNSGATVTVTGSPSYGAAVPPVPSTPSLP